MADESSEEGLDLLSRRVFIQHLTFLGGGVVLIGCRREEPPEPPGPRPHEVLTTSHRSFLDDEYAVMAAACDRILPRDQDPGALDANVPEYIDRMLQSPDLAKLRKDFIEGTQHLDLRSRRMFGKGFALVTPEQQDQLLNLFRTEKAGSGEAHYFELLMTLTMEGFLGDPSYGGNKDHVGWALVGFQTTEPPSGYDGMKSPMHHHSHGGG